MGGIMRNIAFRVAQGCTSLPDGFITEYFYTNENDGYSINGYNVVSEDQFNILFSNNQNLLNTFNANSKLVSQNKASLMQSNSQIVLQNIIATQTKNAQLFQQFLAWMQNQGDGYSDGYM